MGDQNSKMGKGRAYINGMRKITYLNRDRGEQREPVIVGKQKGLGTAWR